MDARIQRLVEEGQRILLKITAAQEDLSVPASQIRGWERDAVANFDRLTELSKGYPFPDPELGEASGRAAIGMATLMALLSRAPGGAIPRDEARRRLAELKRQYGICPDLGHVSRLRWLNVCLARCFVWRGSWNCALGGGLRGWFRGVCADGADLVWGEGCPGGVEVPPRFTRDRAHRVGSHRR